MKWSKCITLICTLVWLTGTPCSGYSAELNGYTFGDDSTQLWENPFFSAQTRLVDLDANLYGYGGFGDKTLTQSYQQTFPVGGINCVLIYEQGYYPDYSSGNSGVRMVMYTAQLYYAKDTENNIHILQQLIFRQSQAINWYYTDLGQDETTLKYPASPVPGQKVFKGQVESTGVDVGDISGCMVIAFDSLPQYPGRTIREYLQPGSGLLAVTYNWEAGLSGFSSDGVAPEEAEEEESGFKGWREDHCFISVCSPRDVEPAGGISWIFGRLQIAALSAASFLKSLI